LAFIRPHPNNALEQLVKHIATLVITMALMMPATALAHASSTCQAYNPQTCSALSTTQRNAVPTSSGSLPFTGLDIVLLVSGGGILVATGLVVRQLLRRVGVTGARHVER
jgi:hypothetical protein